MKRASPFAGDDARQKRIKVSENSLSEEPPHDQPYLPPRLLPKTASPSQPKISPRRPLHRPNLLSTICEDASGDISRSSLLPAVILSPTRYQRNSALEDIGKTPSFSFLDDHSMPVKPASEFWWCYVGEATLTQPSSEFTAHSRLHSPQAVAIAAGWSSLLSPRHFDSLDLRRGFIFIDCDAHLHPWRSRVGALMKGIKRHALARPVVVYDVKALSASSRFKDQRHYRLGELGQI